MSEPRSLRVAALALLALPLPALAHDVPAIDYAEALRRTAAAYDSTGMVAAVMVDGEVVYTGVTGIAEEGTTRPVTEDMLWPIASISKAFTTTALAILVDRGEVEWDAPVRTYVPEFAMWDPWVSEHFTVRDLLTHRSGLPLGAGDLLIWPDGDAAPADVIAALPHLRPSTGFRDGYAYDNLMYVVAGEVVARVSGRDWATFVTEELFQPIGMDDDCAAQMDRIPAGAATVTGHERAAGADAGVPIDPRLAFSETWSAAGGIFCNPRGMMEWGKFWLDGGVTASGTRLVSEAQARELWQGVTPVPVGGTLRSNGSSHLGMYALGWNVRDFEGHLHVSHGGGAPGVVSNFVLIPEHGVAIFSATNDYRGAASTFNYHVANALVGDSPQDYIGEFGSAFAAAEAEGTSLISTTTARPETVAPLSLPLAAYAGTYRDPWYGDVTITQTEEGLYLDMGRSAVLDTTLGHYSGDRFTAFWPDSSLKADAFVDFAVADGVVTGMTMQAISDLTDFSYDFHDLQLTRVPD
ncbi:serine hydrolase [Erythrobacter arachoides]|uniref:Serine hydrolase n=1 Tax=Aurantiacibacter arachoides TaxID=1850444 RepID=A0A845A217_9SPHN|nr:serine hydrolase [Aurantiacibacter arachoides]MXO93620.1 serine hydrolase [Aurantiacibacter arachoides]GGD47990.1 serine hydrolase [Aurantiacibacter arachoides]